MTEKDLIIQDLRRENAELRARVPQWISVKERLPQENEPEGTLCENVQVLLNNGEVSVGWCNTRTKLWWHMEYGEDYFISKDYDIRQLSRGNHWHSRRKENDYEQETS